MKASVNNVVHRGMGREDPWRASAPRLVTCTRPCRHGGCVGPGLRCRDAVECSQRGGRLAPASVRGPLPGARGRGGRIDCGASVPRFASGYGCADRRRTGNRLGERLPRPKPGVRTAAPRRVTFEVWRLHRGITLRQGDRVSPPALRRRADGAAATEKNGAGSRPPAPRNETAQTRQAASADTSVVGGAASAGTSSPGARNPASGPSSFCFLRALW